MPFPGLEVQEVWSLAMALAGGTCEGFDRVATALADFPAVPPLTIEQMTQALQVCAQEVEFLRVQRLSTSLGLSGQTAFERVDVRASRRRALARMLELLGYTDECGWPLAPSLAEYYRSVPDPYRGLLLVPLAVPFGELAVGNYQALISEGHKWSRVVSLCRTGMEDSQGVGLHAEFWLNDIADRARNPTGPQVLEHAAQLVTDSLGEGHRVLVHCAVGRSRSSAVAIRTIELSTKVTYREARSRVLQSLPSAVPLSFTGE